MKKPRKYMVLYGGEKLIEFHTDNEALAERKAILKNGQVWIDTRYEAKMRLFKIKNRIK
jgi:hypothetical protein